MVKLMDHTFMHTASFSIRAGNSVYLFRKVGKKEIRRNIVTSVGLDSQKNMKMLTCQYLHRLVKSALTQSSKMRMPLTATKNMRNCVSQSILNHSTNLIIIYNCQGSS